MLNDNGLALHVSKIAQSLTERVDTAGDSGSRPAAQKPYLGNSVGLLRPGRARRGKEDEDCYERSTYGHAADLTNEQAAELAYGQFAGAGNGTCIVITTIGAPPVGIT